MFKYLAVSVGVIGLAAFDAQGGGGCVSYGHSHGVVAVNHAASYGFGHASYVPSYGYNLAVAVQPNYYSVGFDLDRDKERQAALKSQEILRDSIMQAFRAGSSGSPQQTAPVVPQALPQAAPQDDIGQISAVIAESCVRCHNAQNAKGGIRLDGQIDIGLATSAMAAVYSGKMPPNAPLSDAKKQVFQKLVLKVCGK